MNKKEVDYIDIDELFPKEKGYDMKIVAKKNEKEKESVSKQVIQNNINDNQSFR